ncbi:Fc.00g089550.m01.CDS01 [Cosmosporella sp. VM-42]
MAQPGSGSYGLQRELDTAWPSQIAQRLGNMTTAIPELLDRFDAVSVILLTVTIVVFLIPIFIVFPPIPVERSDALRQTHKRLGLRPQHSNLKNQQASVHGAQEGQAPKVQSLYIYPVKSCRGIEVARSKVLPTGLEYDRLYTLAQLKPPSTAATSNSEEKDADPKWEFLTLRSLPLMANVKVDLWVPDNAKTSRQLGKMDEAFLVLRFPWMDQGLRGLIQWTAAKMSRGLQGVPEKEFMLPIAFPSEAEIKARGYTYEEVKIWKETTMALNLRKEIPAELSRYLGVKHPLGIFRMDPSGRREVFRCAPRKEAIGYQPVIDFQDAYPLHLLSISSVQALDSKLVKDETIKQLNVRRFRANIIISGSEEYEEDEWKTLRLQNDATKEECHFAVSCRTVRCKLPNVDPDTGIRHKVEPDRALRKYRDVDEGAPKMGCLGMQMCPKFPSASTSYELESYIEVGMRIDVLQRGQHKYIKH